MSNFSDIGFTVSTQDEFYNLLRKAHNTSIEVKTDAGVYSIYTDNSGAELYTQFNNSKKLIGANPHFKGKSKRRVCLTRTVERPATALDGAFHCWAAPDRANDPDSGVYPFVFDSPDFKTIGEISFPADFEIQLTAFAHELQVFDNEQEYSDSQTTEMKFATQSFIPSGLFSPGEEKDPDPPQATGIFSGIILECERRTNQMSGADFYWLLVDTLGGEVDVVADPRFFEKEPQVNGVVSGHFWLSGRLINPPAVAPKKSFMQRFFGQ